MCDGTGREYVHRGFRVCVAQPGHRGPEEGERSPVVAQLHEDASQVPLGDRGPIIRAARPLDRRQLDRRLAHVFVVVEACRGLDPAVKCELELRQVFGGTCVCRKLPVAIASVEVAAGVLEALRRHQGLPDPRAGPILSCVRVSPEVRAGAHDDDACHEEGAKGCGGGSHASILRPLER